MLLTMGAASSQPVLDPARALAPYSCASPVRSLPARHHTTTFGCSRRRNYLSYGCFDLRSGKCATGGRSRAPTSPAIADVTAKHTRAALLCHYPSVRRRRPVAAPITATQTTEILQTFQPHVLELQRGADIAALSRAAWLLQPQHTPGIRIEMMMTMGRTIILVTIVEITCKTS